MTTDAIDQLMHIFKQQAKTAKNDATIQKVLKEHAQVERVCTKAETTTTMTPISTPTTKLSAVPSAKPTTTFPQLEIEHPAIDVGQLQRTPVVSQDNSNSISPPTTNTRH
jgi:hypothetical protein